MGDYAVACINGVGAASTLSLIDHNYLMNDDAAAAENIIDIDVASTGIISYNVIKSSHTTTVTDLIDPGSMGTIENYASNTDDETGVIIPVATSS